MFLKSLTLVFLAVSWMQASLAATADLVIKKAKLINTRSLKPIQPSDIYIKDGQVLAIVPSLSPLPRPKARKKINLDGQTVLPGGLADSHFHNFGDQLSPLGSGFDPELGYDNPGYNSLAQRVVYAGILSVADTNANFELADENGQLCVSNPESDVFCNRDKQRRGEVIQPDTYATGGIFAVRGAAFGQKEISILPDTEDVASVRTQVAEYIQVYDPDFITFIHRPKRVMADGRTQGLTRANMKALIATAHKLGKKAYATIEHWGDMEDALKVSVDGFFHAPVDAEDVDETRTAERVIKVLKKRNLPVMTSLTVYTALPRLATESGRARHLRLPFATELIPASLWNAFSDPTQYNERVKSTIEADTRQAPNRLANLKKLLRAQVRVIAGTSASLEGAFVGVGLFDELKTLKNSLDNSGLFARLKVLDMASTASHIEFSGQRTGFDVGTDANFVVYAKSPLKKLSNLRAIDRIFLKGKVVDRSRLDLRVE